MEHRHFEYLNQLEMGDSNSDLSLPEGNSRFMGNLVGICIGPPEQLNSLVCDLARSVN